MKILNSKEKLQGMHIDTDSMVYDSSRQMNPLRLLRRRIHFCSGSLVICMIGNSTRLKKNMDTQSKALEKVTALLNMSIVGIYLRFLGCMLPFVLCFFFMFDVFCVQS